MDLKIIFDLCHLLVKTRKIEVYPLEYRMAIILTLLASIVTTEQSFQL